MSKRYVVAAALELDGLAFSLPAPARHDSVMKAMFALRLDPSRAKQGFLLNDGTFRDRSGALVVAYESGQVTSLRGSVLTSEDLW